MMIASIQEALEVNLNDGKTRLQKRASRFETLLQNELKSDVTRCTTHV